MSVVCIRPARLYRVGGRTSFKIGMVDGQYKIPKCVYINAISSPPLAGELGEMKEGDGIIPPTPPGDGAWPKEGDGTWILPGDAAAGREREGGMGTN